MDQETFDAVMLRVSNGEPLRRILREEVIGWLAFEKRLSEGDNLRRYTRAKEVAMDALADEIMDISDAVATDKDHIAKARLQTDTRKWLMTKLAPKKYGNDTSVSLGDGVKVIVQRDDADL
jgi:hypothetical protein